MALMHDQAMTINRPMILKLYAIGMTATAPSGIAGSGYLDAVEGEGRGELRDPDADGGHGDDAEEPLVGEQ